MQMIEVEIYILIIQPHFDPIEINPNFISTWHSKVLALDKLDGYKEAQKCYDGAESIRNAKKGLIDTLMDRVMDMLRLRRSTVPLEDFVRSVISIAGIPLSCTSSFLNIFVLHQG